MHETNKELRYRFLDRQLWKREYSDILMMLKIDNGDVRVLSEADAKNNDISKDTEQDVRKKVDYIGSHILTLSKNKKILDAIITKNPHMRYYDLTHNKKVVYHEQAKRVRHKLKAEQPK